MNEKTQINHTDLKPIVKILEKKGIPKSKLAKMARDQGYKFVELDKKDERSNKIAGLVHAGFMGVISYALSGLALDEPGFSLDNVAKTVISIGFTSTAYIMLRDLPLSENRKFYKILGDKYNLEV